MSIWIKLQGIKTFFLLIFVKINILSVISMFSGILTLTVMIQNTEK